MKIVASPIMLNVQEEIDNVIEETGLSVLRDIVVEVTRTLLDDCGNDPLLKEKEFSIDVATQIFGSEFSNEIGIAAEVVSRILNREGTTQP